MTTPQSREKALELAREFNTAHFKLDIDWLCDAIATAIDEAVLAERERCAAIVKPFFDLHQKYCTGSLGDAEDALDTWLSLYEPAAPQQADEEE